MLEERLKSLTSNNLAQTLIRTLRQVGGMQPPYRQWHRYAWTPTAASKALRLPLKPNIQLTGLWVRPSATNLTPFPDRNWDPQAPCIYPHPPASVCKCCPKAVGPSYEASTSSEHPLTPAACHHPSCDRWGGTCLRWHRRSLSGLGRNAHLKLTA